MLPLNLQNLKTLYMGALLRFIRKYLFMKNLIIIAKSTCFTASFFLTLTFASSAFSGSKDKEMHNSSHTSTADSCVSGPHYGTYLGYNPLSLSFNPDFCHTQYEYVYYKPCDNEPAPLYVFFTGTAGDWESQWIQKELLVVMAKKGFIAASLEYSFDILFSCRSLEKKSSCAFDAKKSESFISSLQKAGNIHLKKNATVLHGHSQGSFIANLAGQEFKEIQGLLLTGTGVRFGASLTSPPSPLTKYGFNLSSCLTYNAQQLSNKNILAITGIDDEFFYEKKVCDLGSGAIQTNLESVTGRACAAGSYRCLDSEKSGWIIVGSEEVDEGLAHHRYFLQGVNKACPIALKSPKESTPSESWFDNSNDWSRDNTLDWLSRNID
jgi:hypothetical protein